MRLHARPLIRSVAAVLLLSGGLSAHAAETLQLDQTDSRKYGYGFEGVRTHPLVAEFDFQSPKTDLRLKLTTFDIDFNSEVSVHINGLPVGDLATTGDGARGSSTIAIPAEFLNASGTNRLAFKQRREGYIWGVTDLNLSADNSSPSLQIGVADNAPYGYGFNGTSGNRLSAKFRFNAPREIYTLTVTGYDIDRADEVVVRVNGNKIGNLSVTTNQRTGITTLPVNASDLNASGENVLEFVQNIDGWQWGVTDVLLTRGCDYPLVQN